MNFRMKCNIHENQIWNVTHGLSDPLRKHDPLSFIQNIFSDCLLCSWHCFRNEEFSREFNRQSPCLKHLTFSPSNSMVFWLALLTPVKEIELECLRDFFVQHQLFVPYLMECKILEWENHTVFLSLSVFNWLPSKTSLVKKQLLFKRWISVPSSKSKYHFHRILDIFKVMISRLA